LLRGGDEPSLAIAQALEVLSQAVEVEDQVVTRGDVLADFVDDEDDVLLAAFFANDVDHLLHALVFADAWSEAAFAAQFAAAGAATLGVFEEGGLVAFAVFQNTGLEADLLTVATHPDRRSQGLARRLITRLMDDLAREGEAPAVGGEAQPGG